MLPRLYLVTDRTQTAGRSLVEAVSAAIAGGVGLVQLREKDLPAGALYALARELQPICRRAGVRLLINDRVDIALAADADGVHLPANSLSPADARRLLGPARVIGVSAHGVADAQAAAAGGADFVVIGPVFDTPSKQRYGPPLGLDALRAAAAAVRVPVFAIGGATPERVADLRAAGAYGVAAIAALLNVSSPAAAARAFDTGLRGTLP